MLNKLGRFVDRAWETSIVEDKRTMERLNSIAGDVSDYFEAALVHRKTFTNETAAWVCAIIGWMEQENTPPPRMVSQTCLDIIELSKNDENPSNIKLFGISTLQKKMLTHISQKNIAQGSAEEHSRPARKILF